MYNDLKINLKPNNFNDWNLIAIGNILIWCWSQLTFLGEEKIKKETANIKNAVVKTIN